MESGIQVPLKKNRDPVPGIRIHGVESRMYDCDVLDSLLIHEAIWEKTVPGVYLFYIFLFLQVYYCFRV